MYSPINKQTTKNKYIYIDVYVLIHTHIYIYIYIYRDIYGQALRPHPGPPPKWSGKPPPSPPPVAWALVGLIGNPLPSFSPCGVGCGGWESRSLLSPCGVGSGGWESPSLIPLLWWGRLRAGKSWSPGGREASLVRQTIFCGRRF